MELKVKSDKAGSLQVEDRIFSAPFNESLVHQVVVSFLAKARSGTKAQKTRSEVSGGGVKPWRQKGTGRARAGTIRSPLWRTGGVTFAAKPRDFSKKVNKKMYRGAIRAILSELLRQGRLLVIESDSFSSLSNKTKEFVTFLNNNQIGNDVLFVSSTTNSNAYLASRNIPLVDIIDVDALNPVLLVSYQKVVFDEESIKSINEWLA